MSYATDGKTGARLNEPGGPNDDFKVGTILTGNDGTWMRAISGTAITKGQVVHVAISGTAALITAALAITAGQVGVCQTSVTAATGSSFWAQMSGDFGSLAVLGSCAAAVPLYTTDTAGSLDDATASASHHQIMGLMISTTVGTTATVVTARSNGSLIVRRPAP